VVESIESRDEAWMRVAYSLAETAAALGEVPVGAVVVHRDGRLLGTGFNLRETKQDALRHAEIEAIEHACRTLGAWRLSECDLYVTLEPCVMCAGAIHQARLNRVVYGAMDPKAGAMGSLYAIHEDQRLNHRLPVTTGVMGEACGLVLRDFFRARRK
jgi:tRNA(adenine34) deaminase